MNLKELPQISERQLLENKLFRQQTFSGKRKQRAFVQRLKTMSDEQIKNQIK